jgi:glycosyltransferase involved in cell wall biosynthesis
VRHIVYVAHCPAFYHSTSIFRALRNFVAEAIPCRLAERVVVLSQGNRTHYLVRKLVSPPKLVHIANGVDLQEVPSPPAIRAHRQAWNFDTCRFHAVFVGRLDDQKRVAWLLEAWALVARSLHGDASAARLWVVGEGEERHDLERQAETLKLGPTCTFVGARTQAWEWIAASDALVLSSLYEGHALVPLEAMACGLPVVATAVDGVVDSVIHGQTGLLSPPGDVQTFAWNILRLVSDPEFRTALGRRGRERVESFALATTLGRYQQLWEDLRTPPPRSPGVPT